MDRDRTFDFLEALAERLRARTSALAEAWLKRLDALLSVEAHDVFPTVELLDHVPALLGAVADYLVEPAKHEISTRSQVVEAVRRIGRIRSAQGASVHQILLEFDILAELLDDFLADELPDLPPTTPSECLAAQRRLHHATRFLSRATLDTFTAEYARVIDEQRQRLLDLNRTVTHEMRTPIGTLQIASQLLGEVDAPDQLARIADLIARNSERAARLLTTLDQISRADADAAERADVQEVDLRGLASEVAHQLDEVARARRVDIRIAPELPTVVADMGRLELAIANLLSNGIKYSDPDRRERYVEFDCDAGECDADTVVVRVRDNGIGIPAHLHDRVFERFFRAHEERDEELESAGSGLGLPIAASCIRAIGGSIELESEVGVGTTFRVRIPRKPTGPPDPASSEA